MVRFDHKRAVDFSVPSPRPMFGWFGPFPSRPCDECGEEEFRGIDWNMGYACVRCRTVFGTRAEWEYYSHG